LDRTDGPESVPDGGTTAALLGLALAFLGFTKRKLSAYQPRLTMTTAFLSQPSSMGKM